MYQIKSKKSRRRQDASAVTGKDKTGFFPNPLPAKGECCPFYVRNFHLISVAKWKTALKRLTTPMRDGSFRTFEKVQKERTSKQGITNSNQPCTIAIEGQSIDWYNPKIQSTGLNYYSLASARKCQRYGCNSLVIEMISSRLTTWCIVMAL